MRKYILFGLACVLCSSIEAQLFKSVKTVQPLQSTVIYSESNEFPASSVTVGTCSENPESALGTGQFGEIGAALEIPTGMFTANGDKLIAFRLYLGEAPQGSTTVFVADNLTGTPLFSKTFDNLNAGWNYIILDEPITVLDKNLYFGYKLTTDQYLLGLDETAKGLPVSWIWFNGAWVKLTEIPFNGSWGIQAVMTGGDYSSYTQYDAAVVMNKDTKEIVKTNQPFNVMFDVTNNGVMTLTDFDLFVRVGTLKDTLKIRKAVVPYRGIYTVRWENLNLEEEGEMSIAVKVFNLNGDKVDAYPGNNTAYGAMGCFINVFPKHLFIEQFTGQDCGYCPKGAISLYNAIEPYKDQVDVVAHHTFGTDQFSLSESAVIGRRYGVNSAPMIMVDRGVLVGSAYAFHPGYLSSSMMKKLMVKESPVSIELASTYDAKTRQLKITAKGYCPEVLSTASLSVWIIQSGMVAYQSGASGSYSHKNAIRVLLTPTWGDELVRNGTTFENSYEITLPESVGAFACKEEDMRVVAFVSKNSGKAADSQVYNTLSAGVTDATALQIATETELYKIRITGNTVEIMGEYDRIEIYDMNGAPVNYSVATANSFEIEDRGVFVVKIFKKDYVSSRKILIL
ncbi:MAG: Omp28-related outer membrane protein [Bacteroidales bacterium]